MKRKKGFTLLELMVTLSILLILSVMISAILIQSQRILIGVDNKSKIQDEVRTALLKIQTNAQKADEIIVNDKYAVISSNKWELSDNNTSSRELLRIINDDKENIAKVYAEVNYNDNHQLVEFDINKSTHEIINSSKNVLISKIEGEGVNTIDVKLEDVIDSNKKKINELVTINCSKIVKGNKINESDYLISFNNEGNNVINIEIGGNSGNNQGNGNNNNNSNNGNDLDNGNNNSGNDNNQGGNLDNSIITNNNFVISFEVLEDWGKLANWKIKIVNNTGIDVKIESISFNFEKPITVCWSGNFTCLGNNMYKLTPSQWEWYLQKGQSLEINGQCQGGIVNKKIDNVEVKLK